MKILITAGPTYEPIDPVRYIGNRSSGKMGISIANSFAGYGEVVLVLGPTQLRHTVHSDVKVIDVETAQQMYMASVMHAEYDIIIGGAAVSDYKVVNYSGEKIKKSGNITLELEKNVDILYELGRHRIKNQILVGFALETTDLLEYAKSKIEKKNLDMIVANYSDAMNADKSTINIIYKDSMEKHVENTDTKEANALFVRDAVLKLHDTKIGNSQKAVRDLRVKKYDVMYRGDDKITAVSPNNTDFVIIDTKTLDVIVRDIVSIDEETKLPVLSNYRKTFTCTDIPMLANLLDTLTK
jgi:hypothetical protein